MIAKANDIPPMIVPKASNERALGSVHSGNSSYSERAAAIKNEEKKHKTTPSTRLIHAVF